MKRWNLVLPLLLVAAFPRALVAPVSAQESPTASSSNTVTLEALVREALYGGVSGPRRQRMHARAAHAIEQVDVDAPVAALAVHLRLARSGSRGGGVAATPALEQPAECERRHRGGVQLPDQAVGRVLGLRWGTARLGH